ncbi:MAG: hypothetical protein QM611_08310 [Microbacterium sp.]|uniref:hypothetical protein n=1 Tax=Microbacterium sp. TaxID=51671 RepID=UPI0039E5B006
MRWDRFFEDLEDQLDSEWEAERAALDSEAERLRLSRVTLRERLRALAAPAGEGDPVLDLVDDTTASGRLAAVGADWVGMQPPGPQTGVVVVPLAAIRAVALAHADLLRSARPVRSRRADRRGLTDRMSLGFVLRDAARRRIPVTARLLGGRTLAGTVDRAGADHLDLALHEHGSARRASEVVGFRMVPFAALASVRLEGRSDVVG